MADPSVSIVIPTYNRARQLERLLRALAAADRPAALDIYVVDDGSTDGTPALAERAPLPIHYLRQENQGAAAARNRGWATAQSDVVLFTDDDTVPESEWITRMTAAFARTPGVAGIGGAIHPLTRGFLANFVQAERLVDHGVGGASVRYLVTANAGFTREALAAVGGFDESFPGAAGEDTDLSFRMRASGYSLALAPDAVVRHDHRIALRALLRTYRRHGRARVLLKARHPQASIGRGARSMLGVRYWLARYRYYREDSTSLSAAVYCALRAAGLLAYAIGVLEGRRR